MKCLNPAIDMRSSHGWWCGERIEGERAEAAASQQAVVRPRQVRRDCSLNQPWGRVVFAQQHDRGLLGALLPPAEQSFWSLASLTATRLGMLRISTASVSVSQFSNPAELLGISVTRLAEVFSGAFLTPRPLCCCFIPDT